MTLEQAIKRNPYDPNKGKIGAYIRYLRYNVDGWYHRESKAIREELDLQSQNTGGIAMNKIIKGKKYDTNTAKEILSHSSSYSRIDFSFWEETLYQKKTGEFFIFGYGGPMSKYAKSCGHNSWSGGEEIKPITEEEAKEWVEHYGSADEYISIFGEVDE